MVNLNLLRPPAEKYGLQERVLARGALNGIGSAAIDYSFMENGQRTIDGTLTRRDHRDLVTNFRRDPKKALAYMRRNLRAIANDDRLNSESRTARFERYFDAYTTLTSKLDHEAFSSDSRVHRGVPSYIPDGFVDMGSSRSVKPGSRTREQMRVDKAGMYAKYRDVLLDIMSVSDDEMDSGEFKDFAVYSLLSAIHENLNVDYDGARSVGKGVVNLHEMNEGVCRHHALTFQVLAQACGLTSRYVKCTIDGLKHAANAVQINSRWYLVDPTLPDSVISADGTEDWNPAIYRINHEPRVSEALEVTGEHSGVVRSYVIRDDMFSRIAA